MFVKIDFTIGRIVTEVTVLNCGNVLDIVNVKMPISVTFFLELPVADMALMDHCGTPHFLS